GVLFASGGRDAAPPTSVGRLRAMLREQGVVTVALAPLTLLLFGQASVVGLLANLLAIPWVTLVVTPLALGGALFAPLWTLGAWAVQALTWLLSFLAAWPGAVFAAPAAPAWIAGAGVLGGVLLVLRLPPALRLAGLPLVAPMLLWQPPRPPEGQFELLAADVGQGNAVIVRTANHALLYDAGPRYGLDSDAGHRVLAPLLAATGERLDRIVISHRDSDHSGGAASVLAQQPQAELVSSLEDGHALWRGGAPVRCLAGQRWRWDGVDFEFLHPQAPDYAQAGAKPNALSCVLRVSQGAATALLAGDIEAPQELRLVAAHAPELRADLLLAPHHGSKTSSTAAFLAAVRPRIVLVQAGYRNRFGHPAAPVVARYDALPAQVLVSPECGAATWRSADPRAVVCERQASRHYWSHGS
ncbi:MAG TPA: DNA internalization-related competence protein ComEC/Rec2, partial [Ramlibacter sp.]|nr:DNA internalization-related competence protein ComEC/Rec2 [Ramlibacter sp.]